MHHRIRLLTTLEDVDAVIAASTFRPVLVFKHSLTCGTSAWAHDELELWLDEAPSRADVVMVHVQTSRDVSNAITARVGVRHQSPQAILLVGGGVAWHASHHRLTRAALDDAVRQAVPAQPAS